MTNNLSILIPARGGSQRIKNKNIVTINDRHLISYCIEEALKITSEVYVSTNCNSIAGISSSCGAKIIERPNELATATSDVRDAVHHFIEQVASSVVVLLQPTSPLTKQQHILEGIKKLKNYDSVISVCESREFYWTKEGVPLNYNLGQKPRTQDMDPLYRENGAFYITYVKNFLKTNNLISGKVGFVEMPYFSSVDIDTMQDLELVRYILK